MSSEHSENRRPKRKRQLVRDANYFLAKVTEDEINLDLPNIKGKLIDWIDPEVVKWCKERMESLGIKKSRESEDEEKK